MIDPQPQHSRGRARRRRRHRQTRRVPSDLVGSRIVECLESRVALSADAASQAVVLLSASTADSQSVTVDYAWADPAAASAPLNLGVYRSADRNFGAGDVPVASLQVAAAGAVGEKQVTLPIPGGLPPDPERPYVLVVADPSDPATLTDPARTAAFRCYVIGIITHGGLQNQSWKNGPPWELVMARSLRNEGYDAVIPFNWVAESSDPGAAAKQGPRLARKVLQTVSQFPASAPVDLHFIGHSEGTVVNSEALLRIDADPPPQVRAGYVEMTMLDPHAASNAVAGKQYSIGSGLLGWVAGLAIENYQSKANDPAPFVPAGVDNTQVFYQHTPASRDHGVNGGIYNLWGQVPVRGPASYFNLTGTGATHSGKTGVVAWYQRNVVPSLINGPGLVSSRGLAGGPSPADVVATEPARRGGPVARVEARQPSFSGTSAPGSEVRLLAGPARHPSILAQVGRTFAGPDGLWSAVTRPLADGLSRGLAVARRPGDPLRSWRAVEPVAPLGRVDVRAGSPAPAALIPRASRP